MSNPPSADAANAAAIAADIASLPDFTKVAPPEIFVPGKPVERMDGKPSFSMFTPGKNAHSAFLYGSCAWKWFGLTRYVRADLVEEERAGIVRAALDLRALASYLPPDQHPELHVALGDVAARLEALLAPAVAPTEPSPPPPVDAPESAR